MTADRHISVLREEAVRALAPERGGIFIDATFGAGGYSMALLENGANHVLGIDRDPSAINEAQECISLSHGRLQLVQGNFSDLHELAVKNAAHPADGIAFDFGVSSMQLDRPQRGFSLKLDGPLDMRMGQNGPSAADFLNTSEEREIARVIRQYGEEPRANRIAQKIIECRKSAPLTRTSQLADVVLKAIGRRPDARTHPATRTFQAIRIHVNDELGQIERGLRAAEKTLRPGGRLAVVSFHSLEDRLVKKFLRARSGLVPMASRHDPSALSHDRKAPSFRLLSRRPTLPSETEVAFNVRARSAKLRAAERLDSPIYFETDVGEAA